MTRPAWIPDPLPGRTVQTRNDPGIVVAEYEAPYEFTDGFTVQCWWDADSVCWVAHLYDPETDKRTVRFAPMANGETKIEALAQLAIVAYFGLIEGRPA